LTLLEKPSKILFVSYWPININLKASIWKKHTVNFKVMFRHGYFFTDLFPESERHRAGPTATCRAPAKVAVIVALAPAQPVPASTKPQTWHENQVESA